ncbi:hypothetical protein FT663_02568 [Candidozyma haemuli var. vulneris]|uniref:FAD/NAD(P)-binding domain-containing protein n=1 Tax=Candidozyma haemuli TaxID=45357 RepID=A0A2V1AXA2_9ASCO|nr:hypothetical protein CXQ85_005011 [[Candida] haemuloni]KAF3986903.1 hypothetical protein FT662_04315 [[Candida] haemuloni var. vulneris]KAF3991817.1 hypothetical protein FT663_02568 [[Candida] haemuloni var. vulneris]PVH22442.1 hypothetical protein CXQ85_005011 [[Candida] haemuloni]
MTKLASVSKSVAALTTNVLVVGGSFGGMASIVSLKASLKENKPKSRVSVTLVEPKAGFLNVLGVPRAIVDPTFATTQYVPIEQYSAFQFDRLVSDDEYVLKSAGQKIDPEANEDIELTYVQGSITKLSKNVAEYQLNNGTGGTDKIKFDYCVLAAGRNRTWPTSPDALNAENYLKEMKDFNSQVKKCNKIAVVGAGAVGIEIAGDIKTKHQDKEVMLIHPHPTFPPEQLTDEFKKAVRESLERADVKVMTGLRVKRELDNHNLELTNGDIIEADFTYWCNSFKNNTTLLDEELSKYISPKNNIFTNSYFQLHHPETKESVDNIFSVGDMVEFPVIKTAGWAISMGRATGKNLSGLLVDGKLVEEYPGDRSNAMLLVCGNEDIVSEVGGNVEINNPNYVEQYKTYRFKTVRGTLGI